MATTTTAHAEVRGLARVVTLPAPSPGFIGDGHTAIHVIAPHDFDRSDPFILLADDRVDLAPGRPAGGPHPHAGFEIVTFVVDGRLRDRDEGTLRAGDVAWMTAGTGVIHGEDVEPLGPVRILQLWVTSPSQSRWVPPRFSTTAREDVPLRRYPGVEARIYSGTSGDVDAGQHLQLPLTMIDLRLSAGAVFEQALPATYSGFLYPLEGELLVHGSVPEPLSPGQIGWIAPASGTGASSIRLAAGPSGTRVMLYAGERQHVPIVTKGPFIGETRADLIRVGKDWAAGELPRVSELEKGKARV